MVGLEKKELRQHRVIGICGFFGNKRRSSFKLTKASVAALRRHPGRRDQAVVA